MAAWKSLKTGTCFVRDFSILCGNLVWTCLLGIVCLFVPKRKKDLRDQVVLITGSAQGMGRELAMQTAARGAKLVLWDIDEVKLQSVTTDIRAKGGWAQWYKCDVTCEEDVRERAQQVLCEVGAVDILVNNAGIMQNVPILQLDSARIRQTFEINIMAHLWTIRAFLPKMIERNHGHVVAISSASGIMGHVNQCDYAASKFGVVGLMEALSAEMRLEGRDVRLTTICPMTVDTGLNHHPTAKYPFLTPILSTEKAVAEILLAIRTEEFIVTLPRRVYWTIAISKFFPRKCLWLLMDFVDYCRVANSEQETTREVTQMV